MIWSLLLAAGGILGLWLAGRKNYWGWGVGILMQLLWIAYALVTAQYGFLISAFGYGYVYTVNLLKWRSEAKEAHRHERDELRSRGMEELGRSH